MKSDKTVFKISNTNSQIIQDQLRRLIICVKIKVSTLKKKLHLFEV